jgi:hypothetical protein
MKLGIGIPCNYEHVPRAFFESMMILKKPDYELIMSIYGNIDEMRNGIVKEAQRIGCTHLLMMDTDMLYHPDTIYRLLSHNLPVVGALCYRRKPPFDPLMYKGRPGNYHSMDEWETDLVEVDATGTGCLMFDMDIFKRMPEPWFKIRQNPDGSPIGEDIGFCHDLRNAGYKIYVDTTIPAAHLTTMQVTDETYRWYKAVATRNYRAEARI